MPKRTIKRLLLLAAALVLAANGWLYTSNTLGGNTQPFEGDAVHFIDVGQGDCTLLISGDQAILVDAGTAESGEDIIDYLHQQGVERLYAVIATHPHADHIGAMDQVLNEFPTEQFFFGPETTNTATYSRMLDALETQQIPAQVPQPGDTLTLDSGATLTFLGPYDDVPDTNLNDRSLICLFTQDDTSVLLMGDAEQKAEQSLLQHNPSLCCTILKVGHHGAATSSSAAFVQAVSPSIAVISCGRDNDYGHPSEQTLQTFAQAGVQDIRITAQTGTVVIPLDTLSSSKEDAA